MKTLGFNPKLVPSVLDGSKTKTWRAFDDKDLTKGDEISFINSEDKKEFAQVKITSVKNTTFGKLTDVDKKGHEEFSSDEEMYKTYSNYYGKEITPDTELKIIDFELLKDDKKDNKKVEMQDVASQKKESHEISHEENKKSEKSGAQTVVVKGKKKKKMAPFLRGGRGQAHVKASYNNTIVSITDLNGALLAWSTAGKCGFKGPKKATPYAAGVIVKSLVDKIKALGIKELDVFVKGVGTGREAAVRAFDANGVRITSIKDVTPIPHGGCRPKKKRRV